MANYRKSFNFRNGVQVDNDNFIVNANGLVGIGTSIPSEFLDVRGTAKISGVVTTTDLWVSEDVYVSGVSTVKALTATQGNYSGVVTASQFIGDGSALSGIVAIAKTGWVVENDAGISTTANVGVGTTNPLTYLQVGNNPLTSTGVGIDSLGQAYFSGIVTASSFKSTGIITGGNLYSSGVSTFYGQVGFATHVSITGVTTLNDNVEFFGSAGVRSCYWDGSSDNFVFNDDVQAIFGNSSDLSIYHDGGNSYIKDSGTGDLKIQGASDVVIEDTSGANSAVFNTDGSVELYYRGTGGAGKKFETTGTGAVLTGVLTATTFVGALTGTASTATASATAYGLTGSPAVTVGNLVGGSSTLTHLVVDEKIGIGSDIPTADLQIRSTSNAVLDVITSANTSTISVGVNSVGAGNSSGTLSFNSGTLNLTNYDTGGVKVNLHSGTGAGSTESFKVLYDSNTKFETTYDGKVGVNRHGATLSRELEVGGNAYVTGYAQVVGILTVGSGSNEFTLGDGSSLPISASQQFNITSGLSTFHDLLVSRNFKVGSASTFIGDAYVESKLGIGTASSTGFIGIFDGNVFGSMHATGGFIGGTKGGVTTTSDGTLNSDLRSIPSAVSDSVPVLGYGDFQVDAGSFTAFGGQALFVPTVGVVTTGFGATNLGMVPSDFDSKKYLTRVGVNTYFARSVLDVGAATTTMNSYVILPSVNNEELDIIANLWTGNAGGNQNLNPVQSGFGTATSKKLLPDGVPNGSVVFNKESSRIAVGVGTTTFCGVATLTNNHSGYDALGLPTYDTTTRNLMSGYGNLHKGAVMYNTTTNKLNFWNGSSWEAVTSS
jgi:hypothetical protein